MFLDPLFFRRLLKCGMLAAAVTAATVSSCSAQASELTPAQQITRACKLAENQQHPA